MPSDRRTIPWAPSQPATNIACQRSSVPDWLSAACTATPSARSSIAVTAQPKRSVMFARVMRVPEQEPVDEHLIGAEDRLGRLVGRSGGAHELTRVALGGHANARQLPAVQAREVGDVGGVILRHADVAHGRRQAETPEMLHRAAILGAALRIHARIEVGIEDDRLDAIAVEEQRQREADGAAADDHNRALQA